MQTLQKTIEIKIEEKITSKPSFFKPFWRQGEFYFLNEKRVATITDVKFIDDNLLVVANRAAAKLYLVKLSDKGVQIIHKKTLRIKWRRSRNCFVHPDLMAIKDNLIYMTDFSNRIVVYRMKKNKFSLEKIFTIDNYRYHGCCIEGDSLLLGATTNGVVKICDLITNEVNQIQFNSEAEPINDKKVRIKVIDKQGGYYILGLDKQKGKTNAPNEGGDSYVCIFKRVENQLICMSSVQYKNSQIDGHAAYMGYHFFTLHEADFNQGVIRMFAIENDELKLVDSVLCKSFPHGIDVFNGKLAYTSYKESLVELHNLDELFLNFSDKLSS